VCFSPLHGASDDDARRAALGHPAGAVVIRLARRHDQSAYALFVHRLHLGDLTVGLAEGA
jgi:hypothetical protein